MPSHREKQIAQNSLAGFIIQRFSSTLCEWVSHLRQPNLRIAKIPLRFFAMCFLNDVHCRNYILIWLDGTSAQTMTHSKLIGSFPVSLSASLTRAKNFIITSHPPIKLTSCVINAAPAARKRNEEAVEFHTLFSIRAMRSTWTVARKCRRLRGHRAKFLKAEGAARCQFTFITQIFYLGSPFIFLAVTVIEPAAFHLTTWWFIF